METYNDDFNKLNFCDFKVFDMHLNKESKIISIVLEGAYYNKLEILNNIDIKILAWKSMSISMYKPFAKKVINLGEDSYEPLREICQSQLNQNLILNGFGKKTGFWIEYKLLAPKIKVLFENIEKVDEVIFREERLISLNKLVTYIMRHSTSDYKLFFDENGWVSIDELLRIIKLKNSHNFCELDLIQMVEIFSKKRYEIKDKRIRSL